MQRIDFKKVGERVLATCIENGTDKNRGNYQVNVLFSGGENYDRGTQERKEDYGCAMPAVNNGTDEWLQHALIMSEVMTLMGIGWTKEENLSKAEQERDARFAKAIHPKNALEGLTPAAVRLYPNPGRVKPHADKKNCLLRREVIIFSQIVHIGCEIWRVSLIGYMRKSCADAMVRRAACKEVAENTRSYLASIPSHQKPCKKKEDHSEFYSKMGELGLGLLVWSSTSHLPEANFQVMSAALLNRPHMDKPMSYLSAVSDAILKIYRKNRHMTYEDIFLMSLPVGQISGIFTYCSVLTELTMAENIECNGPLRVLDIIINRMVQLSGSYGGGKFPRTQNSWQTGVPCPERTKADIAVISKLCCNSSETPPNGQSYNAYCREMHWKYTTALSKLYGVGDFGSQSLVAVLTQVGVLKPAGMLNEAHFAIGTSTLKDPKKKEDVQNAAVMEYLHQVSKKSSGTAKPKGQAKPSDRGRRLMESVVQHLQEDDPTISTALIEQVNCESYRKKAVTDFYFPFGKNFFYPSHGAMDQRLVWEMSPVIVDGSGDVRVTCEVRQMPEPRKPKQSGCVSDVEAQQKRHFPQDSTFYCRIPFEAFAEYDGLLDDIRARFFAQSGSLESIYTWLSTHATISQLVKQYIRKPVSMKKSMAYLMMQDALSGAKSAPSFEQTKDDNTVGTPATQGASAVGEPLSLLLDMETNTVAKGNKNNGTVRSTSYTVKEVARHTSQNTTAPVIPEANASSPASVGVVITRGSIKHYRFPTASSALAVQKGVPETLSTNRKLQSMKKENHVLSAINSELKRALYFGVAEAKMPLQFRKGSVRPVPCSAATHDLPRRCGITYYMAKIVFDADIDLYVVGQCAVVDQIAQNLGGIQAAKKGVTGLSNWVFPSFAQSKVHLYQTLLLLGGQPGYFKRLYNKLWQKHCKKAKSTTPGFQSQYLLVGLFEPTNDKHPLFYCLLQKDVKVGSIIMSPGLIDPADNGRQSAAPLCFDPILWKKPGLLQVVAAEKRQCDTRSRTWERRVRRKLRIQANPAVVSSSETVERTTSVAAESELDGILELGDSFDPFEEDFFYEDLMGSAIL